MIQSISTLRPHAVHTKQFKRALVHLHLHSEFSLVDGLIRVPALVNRVKELGMPAVAITDQSNLFSMVQFYRKAQQEGVKPIIGADVWIQNRCD